MDVSLLSGVTHHALKCSSKASSDGFLVVFRRLPVSNQAVVSWFSGDRHMVSGSCQVVIR